MVLPVLPQDVIDEIISQLDEDEASTLKACSLVCHSFRHNAQEVLFNSRAFVVSLVNADGGDNGPSKPTNLVLLVKHAPQLIKSIRDLTISGLSIDRRPLDFDASKSNDLVDALAIFSCKGEFPINLEFLTLEDLHWSYIDPWLQHALILLMTVPSLQSITLYTVMDCPANLVQNLPPLLESLSLVDVTFSSLPTTRKELPKLESLTVAFCDRSKGIDRGLDKFSDDTIECIVNATQLKTFEGGDYTPYTMPVFERILRSTSNSLEHLTLEQFDIEDPDSISIDLSQFPRLTDIIIDQVCHGDDFISLIPAMFILITKMMKKISQENVIQNLSFWLSLGQSVNILEVAFYMEDVWQEVDMICSIPQLALSKSFRGITFSIESTTSVYHAFSRLVRNRLPVTRKARKLHINIVTPVH